jgi:hypothetical protein
MIASAIPIPEAEELREFPLERQLRRVPVGEQFEDFYGKQRFEKVAEIINCRGQVRHVVQCLQSPFTQEPGPICSAFFTHVGAVLYLEGGKRVFVRAENLGEAA